jgi:hypothetical protein
LGVELLVYLLKANHKRTLHQMTERCQVRQNSLIGEIPRCPRRRIERRSTSTQPS